MGYYPEPGSHIRDKVKSSIIPVQLCNQKRTRPCYRRWYVWFSYQKRFITLKADVDKLGINKLANVPTSMNILKIKVDYLGWFK